MSDVRIGTFGAGLPYLCLGSGPPLLVASGLSPTHANPTGLMRRAAVSAVLPFAAHFTVYVTNRRVGLAPGTSMAAIAADYAGAVEELGGPVAVHGTSTGGSVALQLAVDRPELVSRLVLASAACRLGPLGRRTQAEVARRIRAGDRGAWAPVAELLAPRPLRLPLGGLARLLGPMITPADPGDLLATIDAEDAFDAEPQLNQVRAATLVLGGSADPFYSEDLFRRTAAGIPHGRVVIFPGKGHLYAAGSSAATGAALGFLLAG